MFVKPMLKLKRCWRLNVKLQDCFIGQNVGVTSRSMGVVTGVVEDIFETKDVDTEEAIWYALVNVGRLDNNLEIKVSKLLGVL